MNKTEKQSTFFADVNRHHSLFLERTLFLLMILIEAGLFLYLISARLIPAGSDGFNYFYLQYYFLNNVVNYGEIPQWCPFLTHVAATTWWLIIQGVLPYFFPVTSLMVFLYFLFYVMFRLKEIRQKIRAINLGLPFILTFLTLLLLSITLYTWTTHAFLFKDQLGNPFKTDSWLLPLDQYMRAYWGQSIHDSSVKLQELVYPSMSVRPRLEFPQEHPGAMKISGVTEDKLQFFRKAKVILSEDMIASYITDLDYKGNMTFLSPAGNGAEHDSSFSVEDVEADRRVHLPYRVMQFDSNNLTVTIQNDDYSPAWLLYSDVWHPFWEATVNGHETPVYKANLAYKAVKLENGCNKVHFYYKSSLLSALYAFFGIISLFWLVVILFMTGKILFGYRGLQRFLTLSFTLSGSACFYVR